MSLEDDSFNQIQADKAYLQNQLDGELQISLLILEMINCESLADFFLTDIQVDHVIYFTVKNADANKN